MYRYNRESTSITTMKCAECGMRLSYRDMYSQSISACSKKCSNGAFEKFLRCAIENAIDSYGSSREKIESYYKSIRSCLYDELMNNRVPKY